MVARVRKDDIYLAPRKNSHPGPWPLASSGHMPATLKEGGDKFYSQLSPAVAPRCARWPLSG